LPVNLVSVDPSPLSAGLYWTDSAHIIPMATDPAYIGRLEEVLEAEKPDAVLVGTDVELPILSAERERLEREHKTVVVVARPEAVAIADDKYLTFKFLKDNGFDYPASCLPADKEGLELLIATIGFPLIVKPRVGARSVGVSKVGNRQELDRVLESSTFDNVIQECVSTANDEFTAGTITFDGKCDASIIMRRDLRDGNTYRAYVEEHPQVDSMLRRMAEKFNAFGPSNFQFRLDGNKAKVFEINARFSGTTPLRAYAGFNEVEMVLRHVLMGEPIVQPDLVPITVLRHWSETIVKPGELLKS